MRSQTAPAAGYNVIYDTIGNEPNEVLDESCGGALRTKSTSTK